MRTPARVLLTGINAYSGAPLRGCRNDVQDLAGFLQVACDVWPSEIARLEDGEATTANMFQALAWFADPTFHGRRLFLFSGHGVDFDVGGARESSLCPVDFDWSPERVITARDLHDAFAGIPADGFACQWISDSCHSGALLRDMPEPGTRDKVFPGGEAQYGLVKTLGAIVADLPHVALLSGCRADQTSADASFGGRANGALTYHVLRELQRPGALDVSLRTLASRTRTALLASGFAQIPQAYGNDTQTDRPFMDSSNGVCLA